MSEFSPEEILRILGAHEVRYVLIGGLAATLHGMAAPTFDVDITPEMTAGNLSRLSAALKALDARIRVDGITEGLPFPHDAASLRDMSTLSLATRYGPLDIASQPAGVTRFDDWDADAAEIVISGIHMRVASLDNIVKSKEAAGRDKDKAQLPLLRALLARLRRSGS
jgi:hypothetical protein